MTPTASSTRASAPAASSRPNLGTPDGRGVRHGARSRRRLRGRRAHRRDRHQPRLRRRPLHGRRQASIPASAATASSRPTSPARPTRPTRSPCSRTARSSSPGTPPPAARRGADNDFALARYNSDGTLDMSFDGDGHRHHRPRHEDRRRAVPWPSSPTAGIVVAGTADGDVALVRYTDTGEVDDVLRRPRHQRVTDFGSDDFANGVALTGDGQILVAGHTLGAGLRPRLRARPLHAPTAGSTRRSAPAASSRPTSAAATTSPRT